MNTVKVSWTITAILAIMLTFVGFKFVTGNVEQTDDGRTAIMLTAPEKDMVLLEMRAFLEGIQTIVEAIAKDDMKTVTAIATSLGMISIGDEPAQLIAKLPLDFKSLGMGTHKAFDDLAMTASDMGDSKIVLMQLGDLILRCTSCHEGYRFVVVADD